MAADAPKGPSVHNPANFEPSDYSVLDYLDKGLAPAGRVAVTGIVLSIKTQDGYMGGTVYKMLLKLTTNAKVWLTCTDASIERGDTVTVKATFEVSRDDPSFAFGKRPIVEGIVKGGA